MSRPNQDDSASGLAELERNLVCSCSCDASGALLLQDLARDDFADYLAADIYDAVLWLVANHQEPNVIIVRKRLLDACGQGTASRYFTHWQACKADTQPHRWMASWAAEVRDAATRRRIVSACQTAIEWAKSPKKPISELLEEIPKLLATALTSSNERPAVIEKEAAITAANDIADEAHRREHGEPVPIVRTSLRRLEENLDGLRPGEYIVLAGPTAGGKSALAQRLAREAASQKVGAVYYWSGEMRRSELIKRAAAMCLRKDHRALTAADLYRFSEEFNQQVWYDDQPTTWDRLLQKVRKFAIRHPLRMLVVDTISLLCKNKYDEVSDVSKGLKQAALEHNIMILALAQYNRDARNRQTKEPELSDLRDSGQIEKDADKIVMLHRPGDWDKRIDLSRIDAHVKKNRNGPCGVAQLAYTGPMFTFDNHSTEPAKRIFIPSRQQPTAKQLSLMPAIDPEEIPI